jgi:hypothetical protein
LKLLGVIEMRSNHEQARKMDMSYNVHAALTDSLKLILRWYGGMIDKKTGRLRYKYCPQFDYFHEGRSPIREIASVWEMELLSDFLERDDLRHDIDRSLEHFSGFCIQKDGYSILNPKRLKEPSSIAHSAFMILSILHSQLPEKQEKACLLAEGILRQQRDSGSYKIYFGDEPDNGSAIPGAE